MSLVESADDQSEDGELRQSPSDLAVNSDINEFSLSEEDAETTETLDIKPPQARSIPAPSRTKHRESKSRHKRGERHRDPHREKRHKTSQHEKERHYREQMGNYIDVQYYRESKEGSGSSRHSERREMRYIEKQTRKERYVDDKWEKAPGDRELEDLRERLLSKRTKPDDTYTKIEKTESHRDRGRHKEIPQPDVGLQGESGMYVKEIINISTVEDKRHKRQERTKEEEQLTEEERAEQDLRREKLLEAVSHMIISFCG